MISYDLKCSKGHVFEAWFPDSGAYEILCRGGKAACPVCGDAKVEKALMTPNVARGGASAGENALKDEKEVTAEAMKTLVKLREQVEENCDHVGDNFAEEARKIHYGEADTRNIYGEATGDEAKELKEEGVEFGEIPWIQRPDN